MVTFIFGGIPPTSTTVTPVTLYCARVSVKRKLWDSMLFFDGYIEELPITRQCDDPHIQRNHFGKAIDMDITISTELADRIERLSPPMEPQEIKRICEKVLEQEVYTREVLQKDPPGMKLTVERLKRERKSFKNGPYRWGYQDGYVDADKVSYEEFHLLCRYRDNPRKSTAHKNWKSEAIKKAPSCMRLAQERLVQHQEKPEFHEAAYLDGWISGVLAFWAKVEHQVEGDD